MKLIYVFIVIATLQVGCASDIPRLTTAGAGVRTISPAIAQTCKHLGLVSSFTPGVFGGIEGAHLDARNKVASKGGNAILIVSSHISGGYDHGNVTAEAYSCTFS
jgi:hypothetical protein